jgi:anti-sigma regulatory factor (Ser/Thr protein kinase)
MTVGLSDQAPREVRHLFERFAEFTEEALLDDLRILSTEIVSNAVRHSGRPPGDPIEVVTTFTSTNVRVEVIDQGQGSTQLTPRSTSPPSGLQLVELVSDRWASVGSFHVWFEIDTHTDGLIGRKA